MNGAAEQGLRVVYVDLGPRRPEFLWWDGAVAPEESFQARQSVHQLFADIVAARRDRTFPGGRCVRAGHRLLVETGLAGQDSVGRPLAATLVIDLGTGPDRLAGAADQTLRVLREQRLPPPERPLPELLDKAEWKSRNAFTRLVLVVLAQHHGA
ncbi:hypothetical protein ACWC3X_44655, partial [Streptomyces populi]